MLLQGWRVLSIKSVAMLLQGWRVLSTKSVAMLLQGWRVLSTKSVAMLLQGWRPRGDSLIVEHQWELEKLNRLEMVQCLSVTVSVSYSVCQLLFTCPRAQRDCS